MDLVSEEAEVVEWEASIKVRLRVTYKSQYIQKENTLN